MCGRGPLTELPSQRILDGGGARGAGSEEGGKGGGGGLVWGAEYRMKRSGEVVDEMVEVREVPEAAGAEYRSRS
jgi:hypothetical protein